MCTDEAVRIKNAYELRDIFGFVWQFHYIIVQKHIQYRKMHKKEPHTVRFFLKLCFYLTAIFFAAINVPLPPSVVISTVSPLLTSITSIQSPTLM